MDQPVEQIADHYRLRLGTSWNRWFQDASHSLPFAGAFQSPLSVEQLVQDRPSAIWPGFMLPDTLPVIGNEYGDWICVRVTADCELGELIYWYHGGGDWIPVGESIEQALLHDVVDQFRPVRQQMLRGAFETLGPRHLDEVSDKLSNNDFRLWLVSGLETTESNASQQLSDIFSTLRGGHYPDALRILLKNQWATAATACDLVEEVLQLPLAKFMEQTQPLASVKDDQALARWMFDMHTFPVPRGLSLPSGDLPQQDWDVAEATCLQILDHRQDLGWASDILGWCLERTGKTVEAINVYHLGRYASSFSNQAVRLRTHWYDQRFGKFSTAQLCQFDTDLSANIANDPYLSVIRHSSSGELLRRVQAFWQQEGQRQLADGDPASAYTNFYRAGWDLGAPRLSNYREILTSLAQAAAAAGWPARESVARTHLRCLESRAKF